MDLARIAVAPSLSYVSRMGVQANKDDWKLTVYGSRMDRLGLTVPPLIGGAGLVYLFGNDFYSQSMSGMAFVSMAAAMCLLTVWWMNTFRPRVRFGFAKEMRRAYPGILAGGIFAAIAGALLGQYGLAIISAYLGYGMAVTWFRFGLSVD